jgi:hypothetical protein
MGGTYFERPEEGGSAAAFAVDLDLLAAAARRAELARRPLVAVLDTSCVRTGLEYQLKRGRPPASLTTVRDGMIRLFMERDTLEETCAKLPEFADQLGVPPSELIRPFSEDWLPYIRVVSIPTGLRQLDARAASVRDLDPDDYPAAALAALLSPCILLTHNYRDFRPLGIREASQGVDAILAAIDIKVGSVQLQAVATVPAVPVVALGAGVKWAADHAGPVVWLLFGLLLLGGVVAYRSQPPERKEEAQRIAGAVGKYLLEEGVQAAGSIQQASELLDTYVVPAPEARTPTSAVFRELAMSSESMSAQQLCETLVYPEQPTVESLRPFLHANKAALFLEVRRGSFRLGRRYSMRSR